MHKFVRLAYVAALVVLSGFALVTWIELDSLRKTPVALPSYQFESLTGSDGVATVVTRGTWMAQEGPPEPLLTTTIECRKDQMQCVESAALVVFVSGKGLLEAQQTVYPVERWTAQEVTTRQVAGKCDSRQLLLDLGDKRARSRVSASEAKGICKEMPARTLDLVTGYKVREPREPAKKP